MPCINFPLPRICFDKKPEWLLDPFHRQPAVQVGSSHILSNASTGGVDNSQRTMEATMRIHLSIIQQFWQEVAPKLVHDWYHYFTSANKQVYLDDVKREMQAFLHSAKRVSTFE